VKVETLLLAEHDWVPNNARLPVILCRHAITVGEVEATASAFETAFRSNGWPPQWRDGIFDYHHYHSTAHEAVGIVSGNARLILGGPKGQDIAVEAGDALILPAGTGHCCVEATKDFLVVGAYPDGQDWDICREAPDASTRKRIADLPVPLSDPLLGRDGAVNMHWHPGL